MDGSFIRSPFAGEQEDLDNSPENSLDSPRSGMINDMSKMTTSTSSPKRSRRAVKKRVVSVPIKDVEGSRLKGEISSPPSDSWAWRKYGQKPIKGSPYPRGYYRCSSSKGCPARKQVERSRVDPTMLVVTYSCEHNHPWPATRNHHNHGHNNHNTSASASASAAATADAEISKSEPEKPETLPKESELNSEEKFRNLGEESLIISNEFGWFAYLESPAASTMLESPILAEDRISDTDMRMIFSMREEDEPLFADLGELPECSVVFRRRGMEMEESRRCGLTPWCGTTI